MVMKIRRLLLIGYILIILLFSSGCIDQNDNKLNLESIKHSSDAVTTMASVGWSIEENYVDAVSEAVTMAKNGLGNETPIFAYVVLTARNSSEENNDTADEIRRQLGPEVKMAGMTTKLGVMTNDGIHVGQNGSIGILLVASKNITFGVGEVDLEDFDTPEEAGNTAINNAIEDAGSPDSPPNMTLYIGTTRRGDDMRILDGIAEVIGAESPVIGGSASDDKISGLWMQLTHRKSYDSGLILVAVYTDLKNGWGFETGYKLTDNKGIATISDGYLISEIDNQPALDVYDEWLNGELYQKLNAGEFNDESGNISFDLIKEFTLLNPVARVLRTEDGRIGHYTVSPIPSTEDVASKKLRVFAEIQEGWEIALYRGTWQTHMNRVETIPSNALERAGLDPGEGMFGIMQFCNGLRSQIPSEEFDKVPAITDDVLGGVPFIGAITGGEHGPLHEIGRNVNANLIECMVVIG
jgi:hypothetical protein